MDELTLHQFLLFNSLQKLGMQPTHDHNLLLNGVKLHASDSQVHIRIVCLQITGCRPILLNLDPLLRKTALNDPLNLCQYHLPSRLHSVQLVLKTAHKLLNLG
jgi:hypothetical protein